MQYMVGPVNHAIMCLFFFTLWGGNVIQGPTLINQVFHKHKDSGTGRGSSRKEVKSTSKKKITERTNDASNLNAVNAA